MKFVYGKQDFRSLSRAQENGFLLTNGLGGYASLSAAFSVTRCDQGVLVGAVSAPNIRAALVHRLSERLSFGAEEIFLSTQKYAGRRQPEEGWRYLSSFVYEYGPAWMYHVRGVQVTRRMAMAHEKNASAVLYEISNRTREEVRLSVIPFVQMTLKGGARRERTRLSFDGQSISGGGYRVFVRTSGGILPAKTQWQQLAYPDDAKDGRPDRGLCGSCCEIVTTVPAGECASLSIVFSMEEERFDAREMLENQKKRMKEIEAACGLKDPVARQLALAADAYISRKAATGGMTILAGYPLFGDWGRDTMISLPGCVLSSGRLEAGKSILRTFLAYEKDGLVPNLFPEGGEKPMYNTVDAALLLINAVYLYVKKTGDLDFAREAWPVMRRIVAAYQSGTHHGIHMDDDGLIAAGEGRDQVTWMDVCVDGVLPTPRHGKPVEINAYWYNALKVMEELAARLGEEDAGFGALAGRVREAFIRQFYMEEKGWLRDVLSGTDADEQLRCNQIWAVTMPFTMLSNEQARRVTDAVFAHLYTPCGLRTLSPDDPQYHETYGGPQFDRDMAYHQGTAWVFPLGAYYLAYLRTRGYTKDAAREVRGQLEPIKAMLREGCVGQLPEIYDGGCPGEGKGCFAQAWSVGEMLRVYEALKEIEA